MKVHRMSNKQFAKFVSGLQGQAAKNPLHLAYKFTDKYDYECRQVATYVGIDWEVKRRLGSVGRFGIWAEHNQELKAWAVREGDKIYQYLDADLEKAVQ